jgi:hypothetical protein
VSPQTPLRSVVKFRRVAVEPQPLESNDPSRGASPFGWVATFEWFLLGIQQVELHRTRQMGLEVDEGEPHRVAAVQTA